MPVKLLAALLLCPLVLPSQNLKDFEGKVTEFTLANGMRFVVMERHQAPVVSFETFVDAGSVNDPHGATGLAHMFEHMIGKGTVTVGSNNWAAEEKALKEVELLYDRLENERRRGDRANAEAVKKIEEQLKAAMEKANTFVEVNAYTRVIEENGGTGFNASTALDYTNYFYSLPSNRAELWFLLTSDFLKKPVYREFYKERDVVREERRMRIESNVQGKLFELMLSTAFQAQPYRTFAGWASDIEGLRASDADAFHKRYYVPSNMVATIVGDINPKQARAWAEKYFGSIPAGPAPPPMAIREPEQEGEKRVQLETTNQPTLLIGYKRPNQRHKDDVVFDVIANVLSSGRTGMLYKDLVRDKKISLGAQAGATFPSGKFTNLFILLSIPAVGKTVEENEKAIYENIEKLKSEKVDQATLDRVKTKLRAGLIRQLDSNQGLASLLAFYEVQYSDWRVMFTGLDEIDKVTADDVQRVVKEYLVDKSKTVAYTVKPKAEAKSAGAKETSK